jgi:hypothetical protein
MTNSYRPQTSPVDTYVQPSTVAPIDHSGGAFGQFVTVLSELNPGINTYFDNKAQRGIDEEQAEGIETAIENAAEGFKDLSKNVNKKEGEQAAKEFIGGSIFAQKAYERTKASMLGGSLQSSLLSDYSSATFKNAKGVERSITAYKFDSPEVQDWLSDKRASYIAKLGDISPANYKKYFLPKLAEATNALTKQHIKNHNEYNFEELKKLTTPLVTRVVAADDDDIEEVKKEIILFEQSINDLGIIGKDRSDINTLIVDQLSDYALQVGLQGDGDLEGAMDVMDLAKLFPYGAGGTYDLSTHKDWIDKRNEIKKDVNNYVHIEEQRKDLREKREAANDIKTTLEKYSNLLGQAEKAEDSEEKGRLEEEASTLLTDLQRRQPTQANKIGIASSALDGSTRERYGEELRRISSGGYEDASAARIAALNWFEDPRTPNTSENRKLFDNLLRAANDVEDGQFTFISKKITELDKLVAGKLASVPGAVLTDTMFLKGPATAEKNRIRIAVSDEFYDWFFNYQDENGKKPSKKEQELKYRELRDEALNDASKWRPSFFDSSEDVKPGDSKKDAGSQNQNLQKDAESQNQDLQGSVSSNPITETINNVVNSVFTPPAAAGTLEEAAKSLPPLPVSKQQSLRDGATELGVKPEDLAAIISYETIGTFDPQIVGEDKDTGDTYQGLIQFGPWEREHYNITPDMSFQDQVKAAVQFLKDRGVKPGHGPKEIYAAVLTGHVSNIEKGGLDWVDANGTTVNKALKDLMPGGGHYKKGVQFLQQQN